MESIAQYKRDETWAPTEKKLARVALTRHSRACTAITQEATLANFFSVGATFRLVYIVQ